MAEKQNAAKLGKVNYRFLKSVKLTRGSLQKSSLIKNKINEKTKTKEKTKIKGSSHPFFAMEFTTKSNVDNKIKSKKAPIRSKECFLYSSFLGRYKLKSKHKKEIGVVAKKTAFQLR